MPVMVGSVSIQWPENGRTALQEEREGASDGLFGERSYWAALHIAEA